MERRDINWTHLNSHLNKVIQALETGADINVPWDYGDVTPLGQTINNNCFHIFKCLIRRGADINLEVEKKGKTPLWEAAHQERLDFVELLLKNGVKRTYWDNYSLLTYSIRYKKSKLFDILIKCGVDVNEIDERGLTPLQTAVRIQKIKLVETLLDYGAEFSIQPALLDAISTEQLPVVELLTERGADVNFQSVTGCTPFTKATKNGNLEITEALIKKGVDVNLLDYEGNSPLNNAIRTIQPDLVQLLVENDANVNQEDGRGNLPITEALNTRSFPIIKLLIEKGAKWDNIRCNNGWSPLTQSVQGRDFDMLKFFLDRKADVNEPDNNQKTPLSLAIETDNVRFAKILVEHGASIVNEVFDKIRQLATVNDNWKRFFEELEEEKKISCT